MGWVFGDQLVDCDFIIAVDGNGCALKAQVLVDVPGKGIVVVNENEIGGGGNWSGGLGIEGRMIDQTQVGHVGIESLLVGFDNWRKQRCQREASIEAESVDESAPYFPRFWSSFPLQVAFPLCLACCILSSSSYHFETFQTHVPALSSRRAICFSYFSGTARMLIH